MTFEVIVGEDNAIVTGIDIDTDESSPRPLSSTPLVQSHRIMFIQTIFHRANEHR